MKNFVSRLFTGKVDLEMQARITAAEIRTDAPQLDLHGADRDNLVKIPNRIDAFIIRYSEQGENDVRIIYGIGKGVLRNETLTILKEYQIGTHPLVEKVLDKGGYCVVLLQK